MAVADGRPARHGKSGQSLVEFALSLVLLVLIALGLVDLGRAFYFAVELKGAAREGARHGSWYVPGAKWNAYLDDDDITAAVNESLRGSNLGAATLRAGCPTGSDGAHNPPYSDSYYPPLTAVNTAWLYICYDTAAGTGGGGALAAGPPPPGDATYAGKDLEVIILMRFGLITGLQLELGSPFQMAANAHMTIQGASP